MEEIKKKRSSWNKGIKGIKASEKTREKLREIWRIKKSNPNFVHNRTGHIPSQETREKLRLANKGKVRYIANEETKRKMSEAAKRKIFTEKHKNNISLGLKGRIPWNKGKEFPELREENSKFWKGGKTKYREILERNNIDMIHCRMCKEKIDKLNIHHVDGNRRNNKLTNLNVLCIQCHQGVHDMKKLYYKNKCEVIL